MSEISQVKSRKDVPLETTRLNSNQSGNIEETPIVPKKVTTVHSFGAITSSKKETIPPQELEKSNDSAILRVLKHETHSYMQLVGK